MGRPRDLPKDAIVQVAYAQWEKENHCIMLQTPRLTIICPDGANDMVGEGMRHRGAGTGDSGEAIPSNHEVVGSPNRWERGITSGLRKVLAPRVLYIPPEAHATLCAGSYLICCMHEKMTWDQTILNTPVCWEVGRSTTYPRRCREDEMSRAMRRP